MAIGDTEAMLYHEGRQEHEEETNRRMSNKELRMTK
jgi:hypothetical protein